jgi:hypothetical protein
MFGSGFFATGPDITPRPLSAGSSGDLWWWEVVGVDEGESVGEVGVAGEHPLAVGDELAVVWGADAGEVRDVIGAAPAAGCEVVDLECPVPGAAGDAAVPVTQRDGAGDLG